MNDYDDDYDEDYDEDNYKPSPTLKQRATKVYRKVEPFLPYVPLAVSLWKRSPYWALVAIFTMLATRPDKKYVQISNCHIVSQPPPKGGSSVGIMVR